LKPARLTEGRSNAALFVVASSTPDDLRRNPGNRAARGHSRQHNAASTHTAIGAHLDVSQNCGAGPDHDATTNFRMPITLFLASAAQRDAMQHRNVIFDNGGLADHDTCAMVDHHTTANTRCRMNIDAEDFRDTALEMEGHRLAPPRPEPVRYAIGLQRVEPLEEKKRLDIGIDGRITLEDGREIGPNVVPQHRCVSKCLLENKSDLHWPDVIIPQFLREMIRESLFQPLVVQDSCVHEACERRLGSRQPDSLLPERRPNRVARGKLLSNGGDRALVHEYNPSTTAP